MWAYSSANSSSDFCHPRPSLAEAVTQVGNAVHEISGVPLSRAPLSGTQLGFNEAAPGLAKWQFDKLNKSISWAEQTLSLVQLGNRPRPDDLLQVQAARSMVSEAAKLRDTMASFLTTYGYDLSQTAQTSYRTQSLNATVESRNFSRPLPQQPHSTPVSTHRTAPPSLRIDTSPAPSIRMAQLHSAHGPGRSRSSKCSSPSDSVVSSIYSIPEDGSIPYSPASTTGSMRSTGHGPYPWKVARRPSSDYGSIRSGSSRDIPGDAFVPLRSSQSKGKLHKRPPSVASSKSGRFKEKLHAWSHLHRCHSQTSGQPTTGEYWYGQELPDSRSQSWCSPGTRTGTFYSDAHDLDDAKWKSQGRKLASQALWKLGSMRDHLRIKHG